MPLTIRAGAVAGNPRAMSAVSFVPTAVQFLELLRDFSICSAEIDAINIQGMERHHINSK
jgi:hypothetical protein